MTGRWREWFRRYKVPLVAVKMFLSLALFVYVVAKVSPGNVWAVVRRANPTYLAAAAALFTPRKLLLPGSSAAWLP